MPQGSRPASADRTINSAGFQRFGNCRSGVSKRDRESCNLVEKLTMISEAKRAVILVVEDDMLIRMDAAQMITRGEFDVIEAANADEAIAILETRSDIAVVFTDIQMPGSMDGLKLAAAVRDRWPPVKIVATSGHVTIGRDDLPDGGRFLPKPYSSAEILNTLRELIA
jgi:CheY-like chemotaxis protein